MKPGVYDISIDEYHSGPGISRSSLREYQRSPMHYHHKHVTKQKETRKPVEIITPRHALEFGNAFHTYVLEHDKYDKEYHVLEKCNRNTIIGRELFTKAQKAANGRTLIDASAQNLIAEMAAQIDFHPEASPLIKDALYEKSIYWNNKESGLLCKARPDIWSNNFIVDLKTTSDASADAFAKSIYNFGYHLQCAMIHDGLNTLYGHEKTNFVFVVVEKEPPYAVVVYTLDEDDLSLGLKQVKETLLDIRESTESNHWPSYPSKTISLPRFAKKDEGILL